MEYKMLDGNAAAVEAMRLAKVQVISAYPITPQSPIAEQLSELTDSRALKAQYVRVESEHSALSVATAAQLTGVRAATATASNGLALMHEIVNVTSGCRVPLVMPVVNRGVAAPWTLWCEHTDAMLERDTGWLQLYCQNVQEVLDIMITSYRIAEDQRVLLPVMVCMDGFFISHSVQKILVPEDEEVSRFVGPYRVKNTILDTQNPMVICDLTPSDEYTEMKYQQSTAMKNALGVIEEVQEEFYKSFGRRLSVTEGYLTEDADVVLVALGSVCGTARYTVDVMRAEGKMVGLLKLTVYRPFPDEAVKAILKGKKAVGVFDRNSCRGAQEGGPLWSDTVAAMRGEDVPIYGYTGGLGGRDVPQQTITRIFEELLQIAGGEKDVHTPWIDIKKYPMKIREVKTDV